MFSGGAMRRRSGSGSGSGDGGEDSDELAELARSIDRAAMPSHVHKERKHVHVAACCSLLACSCFLKPPSMPTGCRAEQVAMRELTRLQRSSEQHPGVPTAHATWTAAISHPQTS